MEAHRPGICPLTPAGVTGLGPRPCGDSGPLLGNLGSRDCSHCGEWHPGGPGKRLRAELSSGLSHAGAPPGRWRCGPASPGLPRGGPGGSGPRHVPANECAARLPGRPACNRAEHGPEHLRGAALTAGAGAPGMLTVFCPPTRLGLHVKQDWLSGVPVGFTGDNVADEC